MRDEKEERKKQARSNKQTRQSNTAHPRQSLFLEKMSCTCGFESHPRQLINPRRAARVTVVVLSFVLPDSVRRLSVTTFSAATRKKTANKRY